MKKIMMLPFGFFGYFLTLLHCSTFFVPLFTKITNNMVFRPLNYINKTYLPSVYRTQYITFILYQYYQNCLIFPTWKHRNACCISYYKLSNKEKSLMFSYLSQMLETESIRNTVPYSIYLFYFIHFFPNKQKFTCHFYLKADYWWLLKGWISTVFRTQSMLGNTWQMLALKHFR